MIPMLLAWVSGMDGKKVEKRRSLVPVDEIRANPRHLEMGRMRNAFEILDGTLMD